MSVDKLSPEAIRRQEQIKRMQVRFREMLDQMDKQYLEDVFNFGLSLGLFAKLGRIHFGYEHNGYMYVVTRWKELPKPLGGVLN